MERSKWGYDYTFDCTGNTKCMRDALEVSHRGWGESCVIGVAAAGHELGTRPFQLVTGRVWKGTAFGGWKSREEVPQLVKRVMRNEIPIDDYVTHTFQGIENVNKSIDALHSGECLRAVVHINSYALTGQAPKLTLKTCIKVNGGYLRQFEHWSTSNQCNMTFSIYIPEQKDRFEAAPGVFYFLSGLTATDENARTKTACYAAAEKYNLAIVFPDTSARGVEIEGQHDDWAFGSGAGFYINATTEKYKKHYNMEDYIIKELPSLINDIFRLDMSKQAVTGHSMGGHGSMSLHFKYPGHFQSVSAFAPIYNPMESPWGKKCFTGYFGSHEAGENHDACNLVRKYQGPKVPILIDQGTKD